MGRHAGIRQFLMAGRLGQPYLCAVGNAPATGNRDYATASLVAHSVANLLDVRCLSFALQFRACLV
jgi:hypothetical protein